MKKQISLFFFISFLSFASVFGYSQNSKIDSLKELVQNTPPDTIQLKALLDLSKSLFRFEPDTAIVYANQAKELAEQLDRKEDLGYALKNIGLAYYIKSDFPEVLNYWEQSLAIFQSIEHKLGISNLLNNLGAVYFSKGDDPNALEKYLASLRMAEELGDKSRIATSLVNIGAVYINDEGTHEQAKEAYFKALALGEELKIPSTIGTAGTNLGEFYLLKDSTDKALLYFNKALKAFEQTGGSIATTLNLMSKAHIKAGDYQQALNFQQRAYDNAISKDSKIEMADALVGMGTVYQLQKAYQNSINRFEQSEKIATDIGANLQLRDSYEGLALANASLQRYGKAYDYQSKVVAIKEEIKSEEYDEKIGNLRFQFDLENKEKEIALLNKDNAFKESEIKRASTFRNFLFALAGLLLVIIGGIYYQYRFTKKANKLLAEERNRSEEILLNILPKDTADELKANGFVKAQKFDQVSILFIDFKEFTKVAEKISAEELVKSVDYFFKNFDHIIDKFRLEKIKTIGDSYMCAGGLPAKNSTHAHDVVMAALHLFEFINATEKNPPEGIHPFKVRMGINTGPVVAGVVGTKKFQYDVWGQSVNIASRMETGSIPGKINISENTYLIVKDRIKSTYRGEIEVKNGGKMKMYFVDEAITAPNTSSISLS